MKAEEAAALLQAAEALFNPVVTIEMMNDKPDSAEVLGVNKGDLRELWQAVLRANGEAP